MSKQIQPLKTLSPQPSLVTPGTPQRLSLTDIFVRWVMIESAKGNTGCSFIATTEADAGTTNRHVLYIEGDMIQIPGAQYGNLDAQINLRELWFNGTVAGDKLVVTFPDITVEIC